MFLLGEFGMADILKALLQGIVSFFINPMLYLFLAGLFLFSAQRVKRERRSFHVKAYGMFNTIFRSLAPSLLAGFFASVVLVALGVSLKPGVFVLLGLCYLVSMLPGQLRFLSPAIAGGLTAVLAFLCPPLSTPYPLINQWIDQIRGVDFISLGCFLSVAALSEALLVLWCGARQTSPRLINSRRGGIVGAHEASQLWIAPMLVLYPSAGSIAAVGPWPFLPHVGSAFGFLIFPVGIGLAQLITHTLPKRAVQTAARWLVAIAGVLIVCTALALWLRLPFLVPFGGLLVFAARLALVYRAHHLRKTSPFYFTQPNQGVRIIGVIPHSPGEAMHIQPGEEIISVNDQKIKNEYEFYEALQKQPAYCKLMVVDRFGEPRIAKGPIHEGDGHRIGFLFLESDKWNHVESTKA